MTTLPEQTPEQALKESNALRKIAIGLGASEQWRGGQDLEWIALAITEAGLRDPGNSNNIAHYLEAEEAQR